MATKRININELGENEPKSKHVHDHNEHRHGNKRRRDRAEPDRDKRNREKRPHGKAENESDTIATPVGAGFFMHGEKIVFNLSDARPQTRLWAFWDDVNVPGMFAPESGVPDAPLITNSVGQLTGTITVPPFTYHTGPHRVKFQDSPVFTPEVISGSTVSGAEATFLSTRLERTTQETIVVVNTVQETVVNTVVKDVVEDVINVTEVNVIGALGDPLAQSFFTYGVEGGCSITKLDLFFATKDDSLPVTVEIRHLVNGYPGPMLADPYARAVLAPSQVNLSATSATATSFVFPYPIPLAENGEYCFVVLSNSNQYRIWTSKLGNNSVETGLKIFDQPFIGSLFQSENNKTWTANQTEDIKFTLHKAVFSSSPATVTFDTVPKQMLVYGSSFSVISGQTTVKANLTFQHGLRTGDFIGISVGSGGVMRGITAAQLTGNFQVTVVSPYIVTFQVGTPATSTGTLLTSGLVNDVQITSGGTNYSAPTIAFDPPSSGVTATATLTVENGSITGVTITQAGTGYTGAPAYTITDTTGSGAQLSVISEAVIFVATNRISNFTRVLAATKVPPGSSLTTTIHSTDRNYNVLSDEYLDITKSYNPSRATMLVSNINKQTFLAGQNPLEVNMELSTANPNTSPLINLSEHPRVTTMGYLINNQTPIEDMSATDGSGTVTGTVPETLDITSPGAGYTTATITISPPDLEDGVQATATATVNAGVVTAVTITDAGSGYISIPSVTVTGTGTITSVAAVQALLTPFNTELLPTHGTALSRYVTKPFILAAVSSGVRVTATAYSGFVSGFDIYFRTSLSTVGVNHSSLPWTIMNCDVTRNKSTKIDEYFDYTFYLDNLPNFDVYDLKIVMKSTSQSIVPRIKGYNVITLAT